MEKKKDYGSSKTKLGNQSINAHYLLGPNSKITNTNPSLLHHPLEACFDFDCG
jgi:hypothetical protein